MISGFDLVGQEDPGIQHESLAYMLCVRVFDCGLTGRTLGAFLTPLLNSSLPYFFHAGETDIAGGLLPCVFLYIYYPSLQVSQGSADSNLYDAVMLNRCTLTHSMHTTRSFMCLQFSDRSWIWTHQAPDPPAGGQITFICPACKLTVFAECMLDVQVIRKAAALEVCPLSNQVKSCKLILDDALIPPSLLQVLMLLLDLRNHPVVSFLSEGVPRCMTVDYVFTAAPALHRASCNNQPG